MHKKDSLEPQNIEEREAKIQKVQTEIDMLQVSKLNEEQMERLLFLLQDLKELDDIPEFDVEEGWRDFKENYMPEIEKFREEEQKIEQRKKIYKKLILKKITHISFVIIFTIAFAGAVIGRTGFVNYFSRNAHEMEVISDKSSEELQKDLNKEYKTLEKEYGIKVGKLNLSSDEYILQGYKLSDKYISIEYLNIDTTENVVFCFFKYKPGSGEFNIEKDDINDTVETYLYQDIIYSIIENKERYYISWNRDGIYYILQNCNSTEECKKIIKNVSY